MLLWLQLYLLLAFQVSHVECAVEDKGDDALKHILDPCWQNDSMIPAASDIYKLSNTRCIVKSKNNRANMQEIVQKISDVIEKL